MTLSLRMPGCRFRVWQRKHLKPGATLGSGGGLVNSAGEILFRIFIHRHRGVGFDLTEAVGASTPLDYLMNKISFYICGAVDRPALGFLVGVDVVDKPLPCALPEIAFNKVKRFGDKQIRL